MGIIGSFISRAPGSCRSQMRGYMYLCAHNLIFASGQDMIIETGLLCDPSDLHPIFKRNMLKWRPTRRPCLADAAGLTGVNMESISDEKSVERI